MGQRYDLATKNYRFEDRVPLCKAAVQNLLRCRHCNVAQSAASVSRSPAHLPFFLLFQVLESKSHNLAVSAICIVELISFAVRAQNAASAVDCEARQDGWRAHQVCLARRVSPRAEIRSALLCRLTYFVRIYFAGCMCLVPSWATRGAVCCAKFVVNIHAVAWTNTKATHITQGQVQPDKPYLFDPN